MRREHRGQIDVKNPAGGHIVEYILSTELRHQFSPVHKTAANGIALAVAVDRGGVKRRHRFNQAIHGEPVFLWKSDRRIHLTAGLARRIDEYLFVAFTLGISVVRALDDNINLLPGVQTDIVYKESLRRDVPRHSMGVAQSISVNFRAGPGHGYKWIRV